MRVDGLPGVRTCVTPVRQGMVVERDRPWRTGERDALRALELAGPLAGAGFYYRHFTDSPRAYRVWERLLANLAAAGRLPDAAAARLCRSAGVQTREVDVCVVGGGAAGVAAALAAARAGRATLLVERDDEIGGALLAETRTLAELDAVGVPPAARAGPGARAKPRPGRHARRRPSCVSWSGVTCLPTCAASPSPRASPRSRRRRTASRSSWARPPRRGATKASCSSRRRPDRCW